MIPVHDEVYSEGFDQPLLFINSELGYQWQDNVDNIMKLVKTTDQKGYTLLHLHVQQIEYVFFCALEKTTPVLTLR